MLAATMKKGTTTMKLALEDFVTAFMGADDADKEAALRRLKGEGRDVDTPVGVEPFITLKECARQIGVSACTAWRWGIPGHDLAGRRRFRMSEVRAYLESDDFRDRAEHLREERRERASQPGGCGVSKKNNSGRSPEKGKAA